MRDVHEIPRATSLDHEILRVFQQIGIVEAIAPFIEPFTPSEYFGVNGQLIRRMTMVAPPYPQGYTPSMVFTQPAVERALRARAAVKLPHPAGPAPALGNFTQARRRPALGGPRPRARGSCWSAG